MNDKNKIKEMIADHDAKMAYRDLCTKYHVGQKRLIEILDANGVKRRTRKWITPDLRREVRQAYESGEKITDISERLEISNHSVWKCVTDMPRRKASSNKESVMDQAQELRYQGLSTKEVAARLKVSERMVVKYTISGREQFERKPPTIAADQIARRLAVPRMPV